METAVIGAGVSGLSCAIELAKKGARPVIFEKNSHVGDVLNYSGLWLGQMNFNMLDPFKYLKNRFNLELKPMGKLNEIRIFSPGRKLKVKGKLGYIVKRGREPYSLENQLASKLNLPIRFDSFINIDDIRESFDRIIVATGDNCIAKRLHVWTDTFTAFARVASALGRFKTDLAFLWLNNDYAINSFCYLVPNSEKEASLCMIVNGITHAELDYYWKRFLIKEDIRYEITEIRDAEHCCGFVEPLHKNGIYFIGNSGGFTDDFIGTGAYNAILSGIYAARAVMDGKDYEVLCKPVYKNVKKLHEFRKTVNVLENRDYDRLLFLLGAPGIKQYIYKNPFFKVSRHAFIAKAMRITFSRL